ncbi:MAG: ProQ/FinO family protein [Candidatus Competibacteraceae bacterium]
MADPSLAGADPAPASAPNILALAETYPACFDGENPRPLKLGIHHDLMAAGFEKAAVKRTLARYCNRPRYRKALRAGAIRIDLQGQPAGVVTAAEAETARWYLDRPESGPTCAIVLRRIPPYPPTTLPCPRKPSCPDVSNSPSSFPSCRNRCPSKAA